LSSLRTLGFLVLLLPLLTQGQQATERLAMNNIQKGKWEKARGQLTKALRKDSINATARFVLSTYYFSPGNPAFQLDSAYRSVMRALEDFTLSEPRQKDRMKRFPLDSAMLVQRRMAIDSAAFERAKLLNTEQAYLYFIHRFPFAVQQQRAMELRDEVAFIDALKENTYQSYLQFLNKYPNASRAKDARDRYERLLYEAKTRDGKLASYKSFLEEYPGSPFRNEAQLQVFEISTASGNSRAFVEFIKQYPDSRLISRARNILYHLLQEDNKPIPASLMSDSLRTLRQLEGIYLVPFLKDRKFGFMNAAGKEIIRPIAKELDAGYICGNITEELLVADNKILARNGSVLYEGNITELHDLGYGFIMAVGKTCSTLLHKSGIAFEECVQDARVVAGAYLAIRKNNRWLLKTFTGRLLPVGEFEDVGSVDEVLILKQAGNFKLIRNDELARAADQLVPVFSRPYDEVRRWDANLLWVRAADRQAILGMDLKEKISLGKKEVQPAFFGAVIKLPNGHKLWSLGTGESEVFQDVQIQKPWIAAKKNGRWQLLNQTFRSGTPSTLDSLYFIGPISVGISQDSMRVFVAPDVSIGLRAQANIQFLPGKDSTYFLLVEEREGKSVYNSKGEKIFTASYDRIEYAGENMFLVIRKDKRGLINLQGKVVLPIEYDAMGNPNHGMIPVLRNRKFGFVDVQRRKEIKPVYEKNLVSFNSQYLIAFKSGYYGIIDWNNKAVTPFAYEEIRYWNDSTALVKHNFQWVIYNFIEKKIVADKIASFQWLRNEESEKLIIFKQENNFGVLSSKRGIVLPATYSDIVNLGSGSQPLYFTEKHVEEASIYIVIYYDENGKLLHRQIFEAEDYERIYCSNK
jgi:hypothetical protein